MKKNIVKILVLIIIDQLIKVMVIGTLGTRGESITLIPNFLNLTYIENTGGAFGISVERIFLIGVDLLIIFFIIKLMTNKKYQIENTANLGLSLILSGGIGNLIDRIFRGHVVDYIDMSKLFSFPIFNFSDILIVIGVILIIITIILNTIKSQENMNEEV